MIKFIVLDVVCGFLLGIYWGVLGTSATLVVLATIYFGVTIYGLNYCQAKLFGMLWRRFHKEQV